MARKAGQTREVLLGIAVLNARSAYDDANAGLDIDAAVDAERARITSKEYINEQIAKLKDPASIEAKLKAFRARCETRAKGSNPAAARFALDQATFATAANDGKFYDLSTLSDTEWEEACAIADKYAATAEKWLAENTPAS